MDKIVVKAKNRGRHRAGYYFKPNDWREVEVNEAQRQAIANDNELVIQGNTSAKSAAQKDTSNPFALEQSVHDSLTGLPDDAFTTAGKPKTDVLSELFGREVSAKERDTIWGAHLTHLGKSG